MSQENVEIVRRAIAEFDKSQRPIESFAPNFVWDVRTYRGFPVEREYRGWPGFFEFFEEWVDAYDEWNHEIEEVLDAGGNRVVALVHQRGRLHESEAWVEAHTGLVYTVEEGLIRRVQVHGTHEEALEAAGLRE